MNTLKQWGVIASAAGLGAVGVLGVGAAASAGDGNHKSFTITERLSGYHETPLALSTSGSGSIRLRINPDAGTIAYTVRYANLEGAVTQSHIHFGSPVPDRRGQRLPLQQPRQRPGRHARLSDDQPGRGQRDAGRG